MKSKKKTAKVVVSLVLVVALIAAACIYIVQKNEADKYKAVIMDVTTDTITQTLSTTGTVESTNRGEFLIYSGVVPKTVHVKLGDRVEKGQLLATFEASSLNCAIADAIVPCAIEEAVRTGTPTIVVVETVSQASIFAISVSAAFFAILYVSSS